MISQEELDIFTVRGFLGIVKILECRLRDSQQGFSAQVNQELTEVESRMRRVLAEISMRRTLKARYEASLDKLDIWFTHGFSTLAEFLHRRVSDGGPFDVTTRERLLIEINSLIETVKRIK